MVRYTPGRSLDLPAVVNVRRNPVAGGNIFVDANGLTLYVLKSGSPDSEVGCPSLNSNACRNLWIPFIAPGIANSVGKFKVITRVDGTKQWSYEGQALFTFSGDSEPDDANGQGVDARLSVALLSLDFRPPQVIAQKIPARGVILATVEGRPLYTRHPFEFRWGARNARNGFNNSYSKGKLLGGRGCDVECQREWHPFMASTDAVASGYWEIFTREDGSRQWAYKGYALYAYTGDVRPGSVAGSNRYEYVLGKNDRYPLDLAASATMPGFSGGAGFFWHVGQP